MYPVFYKCPDGTPLFVTTEAIEYTKNERSIPTAIPSKPQDKVHFEACAAITSLGGSKSDKTAVLGQYVCQFGAFRGQTFKWVVENALGWAAALAVSVSKEVKTSAPLSCNKFALKEYLELFPIGRKAIDLKKQEKQKGSGNLVLQESGSTKKAPAIKKKLQQKKSTKLSADAPSTSGVCPLSARNAKSARSTRASNAGVASSTSLLGEVNEPQFEMLLHEAAADLESQAALTPISLLLPDGWKESLPKFDHAWVSQKFFSMAGITAKPKFNYDVVEDLWHYPPSPPLFHHQPPKIDHYYATPLFVWMPRKIMEIKVWCPEQGCCKELISAGLYPRTRTILGKKSYYSIVAEYLECTACEKKYTSWDDRIVSQLDLAHQQIFPAVLTYRYGCDKEVVEMMRSRGLGNSTTQIQRRLVEMHFNHWMRKSLLFLADWQAYGKASLSSLAAPETPPKQTNVPSVKWLLSVHLQDVVNRVPALKASITSTFGTILKIDSNKNVCSTNSHVLVVNGVHVSWHVLL